MNELLLFLSLVSSSTAAAGDPAGAPGRPAQAPPSPAPLIPTSMTVPVSVAPAPAARRHAILFFTATWCPSCVRMKSQTLPNVSLPGHELRVIDIDANPQLGQSYGIQSLPAYVVLDGVGRAYRHGIGFRDVRQFVDFLNGR